MSLTPGSYVVCDVAQATWNQSKPFTSTTLFRSQGVANGGYNITVTSGSSETGNNFGNFQNATKGGMKFNILNANVGKAAAEPALTGWVINAYADTNTNGVLDAAEFTAGAKGTATTGSGGT